jgi:hypothetical protein
MAARLTVGRLVVPYMVDERRQPIDFKVVHPGHVAKCAQQRRCGVCGKVINGYLAFIGPNDQRRCYADPWMHPACARLALEQCPFLGGRDWRDGTVEPLLASYHGNMVAVTAPAGRAHYEVAQRVGAWHFEALGELRRLPRVAADADAT